MAAVYLNGKFTLQPTTGVQRVASRLVRALDAQLGGAAGWQLLCPPGAPPLALRNIEQRCVGPAGRPLHLWEQFSLPNAAREGLLVNLAGSAPYRARRQTALLHDAAVWDHPEAYTRGFVWWYRALFRRLARSAVRLFTVSAFSRQRLAACLQAPPDRFTLLPNGSDHLDDVVPDEGVLGRHGLQGTRFLLAVGSANPNKNLARLVAAFATLPADPSLRLVIVGGRNERVFRGDVAPDDPPGVLRAGWLDDAPLKALYQHAVALVFPSRYEGFGLPPLEAMASGCPVAVARAAAMPEVCGDAALYFDPCSVDEIAAAMRRMLEDAVMRDRLRQAGLAQAGGFSWARSAAQLRAALAGAGNA